MQHSCPFGYPYHRCLPSWMGCTPRCPCCASDVDSIRGTHAHQHFGAACSLPGLPRVPASSLRSTHLDNLGQYCRRPTASGTGVRATSCSIRRNFQGCRPSWQMHSARPGTSIMSGSSTAQLLPGVFRTPNGGNLTISLQTV